MLTDDNPYHKIEQHLGEYVLSGNDDTFIQHDSLLFTQQKIFPFYKVTVFGEM